MVTGPPLVTLAAAAGLGTLAAALSIRVSLLRRGEGIALGDRDCDPLRRAIRAHGNLTETAPLFLILLGLLEIHGSYGMAMPVLAGAFGTARLAHAIGMAGAAPFAPLRTVGGIVTVLTLLIMAGLAAKLAVGMTGP